jgi:hypothetical protein
MYQTFRMGIRNPKNGVVTIASFVEDNKIFYGVSYCSPAEKRYDRKFGAQLAKERMEVNMDQDIFVPLIELQHSAIVRQIVEDMLEKDEYPRWAENLIYENLYYPSGLKRYSKKNDGSNFHISQITVNSEESKEQLVKALEYIHDLCDIDTNFIAVNELIHLYCYPSNIVVE